MAAEFSFTPKKVDLSKVSNAVKNVVSNIAKTDGSKRKIDSYNEYQLLSMYLAGNSSQMTNDEIWYIEGFMIDYQNKQQEEFVENHVTDNTKKEVSKIAKRMGDKKKIDTDEEAQALALMLKNTHNDLNQADMVYIQNLLINSGYENYLPQPEQPPVQVVNVTINEIFVEEGKNEATSGAVDDTVPVQEDKPKNVLPSKPKFRPRRPIPQKPEKPERKEDVNEKPTIAEEDRNKGFGLADRIVHELNNTIADNRKIKGALREVDSKNAYSFIGKFTSAAKKGINKGVFSVSDLFNRLTYNDTLHVMESLLKQAADIKLNDTAAYRELEAEIAYAARLLSEDPDADPTKETIRKADRAINNLYNEMSKVYG